MGRSILNPDRDQLECLRTASNLSNSVIVDNVSTDLGQTALVGASDLVFTKKSFVIFWFWFMFGGKLYQKNLMEQPVLFDIVLELNPQFFDHYTDVGEEIPIEKIQSLVFQRLNKRLKDIDIAQKVAILQRVVEEIPN